jgi:hypothetical protein
MTENGGPSLGGKQDIDTKERKVTWVVSVHTGPEGAGTDRLSAVWDPGYSF